MHATLGTAPVSTASFVREASHSPQVFVVDPDAEGRRSLALLIEAAGWKCETFACAEDFLARRLPMGPSCLVLDVTLLGLSGLELQNELAERTDMPIIVITEHQDVPMTVRAMKAGAAECLLKPVQDTALIEAIHAAIDESGARCRRDCETQRLRACHDTLTPREREVMALVVAGLLNKQVAGELGISEITVKAHRGQVMRKMTAGSLPHLVMMASRLGVSALDRLFQ